MPTEDKGTIENRPTATVGIGEKLTATEFAEFIQRLSSRADFSLYGKDYKLSTVFAIRACEKAWGLVSKKILKNDTWNGYFSEGTRERLERDTFRFLETFKEEIVLNIENWISQDVFTLGKNCKTETVAGFPFRLNISARPSISIRQPDEPIISVDLRSIFCEVLPIGRFSGTTEKTFAFVITTSIKEFRNNLDGLIRNTVGEFNRQNLKGSVKGDLEAFLADAPPLFKFQSQ